MRRLALAETSPLRLCSSVLLLASMTLCLVMLEYSLGGARLSVVPIVVMTLVSGLRRVLRTLPEPTAKACGMFLVRPWFDSLTLWILARGQV